MLYVERTFCWECVVHGTEITILYGVSDAAVI